MNNRVSTNIFKLSRKQFILLLTRLVAIKWLVIPMILLLIAITITFILNDIRFVIIGLMILFIIIPMILAFLYISYGLMENCYINIIEHEVEFSSECLILKSHIKKITDEENEETEIRIMERKLPWDAISKVTYNIDNLMLLINKPNFGFLLIPTSSFNSNDDENMAISIIKQQTQNTLNHKKI